MEMDPGVLMSLMNQDENTGFEFIWVLLIFLIFGYGGGNGFGNGGNGVGNMEAAVKAANCDQSQMGMLFNAITGNRDAIGQLAASLGTDTQLLSQAVNSISSGICDLGYKMGMDSRDVISAITSGNSSLQAALADCCCNTNRNIDAVRYDMALAKGELNTGIKDATYALAKNQTEISNQIQSGFCDLGNRMSNEIRDLNYNQQQGFQGIINHLNAQETSKLRDELQSAQFQISQISQTQKIIDSICGSTICCPDKKPLP